MRSWKQIGEVTPDVEAGLLRLKQAVGLVPGGVTDSGAGTPEPGRVSIGQEGAAWLFGKGSEKPPSARSSAKEEKIFPSVFENERDSRNLNISGHEEYLEDPY